MERIAFQLKIRKDKMDAYDQAHAAVWPELIKRIRDAGISDYSIFRRGQFIFLVMRVTDFNHAWDKLANDPIDQKWQREMAEIFEEKQDIEPGERFPVFREFFHME